MSLRESAKINAALIQSVNDARDVLRAVIAGAYEEADSIIERVVLFKMDLHTEFKALDDAFARIIDGDQVPAADVEAKQEEAKEPDKAEEKADAA